MGDVYIVSACRTAVGKMGGSLTPLSAEDLAAETMRAVIDRCGIAAEEIDQVYFGQCRQSSDSSNVARVAALRAGIPEEVPAGTVMCACASGMMAVQNAVGAIASGMVNTVLAGGTESMSNGIFYLSNARYGVGTGNTQLKDSLTEAQFCSQPQDVYGRFNMGMTAENIAERYQISREDQDRFALASQEKAVKAIKAGKFKEEIIPLTVPQGKKKPPILFDTDEFPRETSLEKLSTLKPVFRTDENGCVTAGNASGRNDGASALILMSEEKVVELGIQPLARVKSIAAAGVDPRYMGLGPIPATKKALAKAGLSLGDIELIELNEAFASQSLACIRELGLDPEIVNVNGGAIALGHPIGSSGSRIIVTLLYEMIKRDAKYGLATLCVAGGMGMATVIEKV